MRTGNQPVDSLESALSKPVLKVSGNEGVIGWLGCCDSIEFELLTGRQRLFWIKAQVRWQQPLPTEHFVDTGDATRKTVGSIEDGGVGIGQ